MRPLYKPKKKKIKLTIRDWIEIVAIIIVSSILIVWAGASVYKTIKTVLTPTYSIYTKSISDYVAMLDSEAEAGKEEALQDLLGDSEIMTEGTEEMNSTPETTSEPTPSITPTPEPTPVPTQETTPAPTPEVTETEAKPSVPPQPQTEPSTYTAVDSLNIRSAPDMSAAVIARYKKGETVSVIAEVGEWYQVKDHGVNGYVSKEYVQVD